MKAEGRSLNKAVRQVGFWSAILVTIWAIWFVGAFFNYLPALPSEWPGIEEFARSFESFPYLMWVVPCLLLALTFPILIISVRHYAPEDKKIWSWIGIVFAIMYGAVLSTNYWLLMTVVRESLLGGYTEGLEWFVIGSPHSITNTIEGIGYCFMGLSMLFTGFVFNGDRLERACRRLFIVNGAAGIAGVILGGIGIMVGTMVSLVLWAITFPVATVLTALLFRRSRV